MSHPGHFRNTIGAQQESEGFVIPAWVPEDLAELMVAWDQLSIETRQEIMAKIEEISDWRENGH